MPIRSIRDLNAFGPRFLVVCPHCSKCAVLTQNVGATKRDATLDCPQCDFARQWRDGDVELERPWHWFDNAGIRMGHPVPTGWRGALVHLWVGSNDAAEQTKPLNVRLWLQTPCGEENLWLLGDEHLVFLRGYLDDSVRNHPTYLASEVYRKKVQWVASWIERVDRVTVLEAVRKLRRELGTPL